MTFRALAILFLAAMWLIAAPATVSADFCDPWQACDSDGDCNQGVCLNTVCQCGAEEGRPICGDNCADRGLEFSPGGDTVHIDDCRGINSGGGGGVISYCFQPSCVPDYGSGCSASNSCGMTNYGTIQCDGSCNASPPPESACGNPPIGWHETADCTSTSGWTFDPDYAGSTTAIVYRDGPAGGGGVLMATVPANLARPEVETWAQGAGYSPPNRTNSGWSWTIPASLKNGVPHSLYVYGVNVNSGGTPSGSNPLLSGSPKSITCIDPPVGTLTGATCGTATGNATDPQGSPVNIQIYDGIAGSGGVLIGSGTANPNFSVNFTPFTDGQTHTLYAYAQDISGGTWFQLSGSTAVTCDPTVALGAVPTNVSYGASATLAWNVTNGTSCSATPPGWFNPATIVNGAGSGSGSSGPLEATTTFMLACANQIGTTASASATVTVDVPLPTATITGIGNTDYCTAGPGMVIDWRYDSPARPIGSYQVQVLDGGGVAVFDTGKTPYAAVPGPAYARSWPQRLVASLANVFWPFAQAAGPYVTNSSTITAQGQPGQIDFSTLYVVRVRVWDTDNQESAWASTTHFTLPGPWPKADFTNDPPTPAAGLIIQFTDQSAAAPTMWAWTFGDGVFASEQNPQHAFATEGSYDVTLWASNAAGTCSITKTLGVQKAIPIFKEVRPQ